MELKARNGDKSFMDTLEQDWMNGVCLASDQDKSSIRNAFNHIFYTKECPNLEKEARNGDRSFMHILETMWDDKRCLATDQVKVSIRDTHNLNKRGGLKDGLWHEKKQGESLWTKLWKMRISIPY